MAAKTTRKDPVERKEGDERKKALNAALASIEKQFGKGAIMRMADGVEQQNIEVVSTGSLGLDLALGVVDCRAAVLLKYMAQSLPVRRRFRSK